LNSGDEELHGNSADPQLLPKRREKGVDDGTGTANRRFAVAAADWESVGGARTPESEGFPADADRDRRKSDCDRWG